MATLEGFASEQPRGTDRLLYGMVLGVLAFWLFAQTTLNIAQTMARDLGLATSVMNVAVSITALFSGTFLVAMVALQVLVTQGGSLGWLSPASLGLLAIVVVVGLVFFRIESGNPNSFVDFRLFRNLTYTGATLSNLLLNAVAGIIVAMTLVQVGGGMSAQAAGLLTLGYAIAVVAFIRVGEKLLQRYGPRRPMIWGSLIVGATILLLMPTNLFLSTYRLPAAVAFTLFGIGLGFYATPSTDAALANLPADQAGAGSGIYKMASSLGASFGVAISAAIFTALSVNPGPVTWIAGVVAFVGCQDNLAVREAALFAYGANLLMIVAAIVSIVLLVPTGRSRSEPHASTRVPDTHTRSEALS